MYDHDFVYIQTWRNKACFLARLEFWYALNMHGYVILMGMWRKHFLSIYIWHVLWSRYKLQNQKTDLLIFFFKPCVLVHTSWSTTNKDFAFATPNQKHAGTVWKMQLHCIWSYIYFDFYLFAKSITQYISYVTWLTLFCLLIYRYSCNAFRNNLEKYLTLCNVDISSNSNSRWACLLDWVIL